MRIKNKLLSIALAAFLTFAIAGQAAAAMDPGQLYQCIYEGTTDAGYEFATDVGDAMNLANRTVSTGQPAEGLGDFTTTVWADLYAGFVAQHSVIDKTSPWAWKTTYNAFFATTAAAASHASELVNSGQFYVFQPNVSGLMGSITSGTGQEKSTIVSYWEYIENLSGSMDNTQGIYSGFNNYEEYGFVNLAALGEDLNGDGVDEPKLDSYVDMYLWQYRKFVDDAGPGHEGLVNIDGDYEDTYVAKIRIGIDGDGELYTTTNPVPIPGAVWLFGSGLLGLVGIRRRKLA